MMHRLCDTLYDKAVKFSLLFILQIERKKILHAWQVCVKYAAKILRKGRSFFRFIQYVTSIVPVPPMQNGTEPFLRCSSKERDPGTRFGNAVPYDTGYTVRWRFIDRCSFRFLRISCRHFSLQTCSLTMTPDVLPRPLPFERCCLHSREPSTRM